MSDKKTISLKVQMSVGIDVPYSFTTEFTEESLLAANNPLILVKSAIEENINALLLHVMAIKLKSLRKEI